MDSGKSHKERQKDRLMRERGQKINKPSVEPQPPLISPDKAGYRARLTARVCARFSVCRFVAFRNLLVGCVLKERERERTSVLEKKQKL